MAFSANDLANMKTTQEAHMLDTCQVLNFSEGVPDDYNIPQPAVESSQDTVCGYNPTKYEEVQDEGDVELIDAEIRLPSDTEIYTDSRIRVTHRFGAVLTEQPVYELIGGPRPGPSGLLCKCRLVTDGSGAGQGESS